MIDNYDTLSGLSMATRVCQGDVLSKSSSIADAFSEVDEYLGDGGATGSMMAVLSLVAWYCTIAIEFNAIFDSLSITFSIPMGDTTEIVGTDGQYTIIALAKWRMFVRIVVSAIRIVVAVFMVQVGTQFLVYEIGIGDLLLNAGESGAEPL